MPYQFHGNGMCGMQCLLTFKISVFLVSVVEIYTVVLSSFF